VVLAAEPLPPPGEALDTLIVAGGQGAEAAAESPVPLDWVRARAARARRIASVCTGALLLAAAGMLDGRRAVTHWMYCHSLTQRYAAVHVEPDPIFVRDVRFGHRPGSRRQSTWRWHWWKKKTSDAQRRSPWPATWWFFSSDPADRHSALRWPCKPQRTNSAHFMCGSMLTSWMSFRFRSWPIGRE
jgi:DJ-1/PfpI family